MSPARLPPGFGPAFRANAKWTGSRHFAKAVVAERLAVVPGDGHGAGQKPGGGLKRPTPPSGDRPAGGIRMEARYELAAPRLSPAPFRKFTKP